MSTDKFIHGVYLVLITALVGGLGKIIWTYRQNLINFSKRLYIKIFPQKFNIAFALDFNEGFNSGNYYKQIKKNFTKLMDDCDLSSQIRIIDFSDIFLFKNRQEAESFRTQKGIDLIVWGGFSGDNLKREGKVVNDISLSFTFGNEKMSNQIGSLIILDIQSKFALKNYWTIFESESLRDIEIVSNNMFDLSTYILALILKIFGSLDKSTFLFEKLYNDLERRKDTFKEHVKPHLLNCFEILSLEFGLTGKDIDLAINYCEKMLSIDSENFTAIANRPFFYYKKGKTEEAENYVEVLKRLYPNNPITIVDIAFFRIIQKDYSRALKGYKKLLKYTTLNFNLQTVIEFLDIQYQQEKEPALLFASGFLSCCYGDVKSGKSDLRLFSKKAKSYLYNDMKREAKKLMRTRENK